MKRLLTALLLCLLLVCGSAGAEGVESAMGVERTERAGGASPSPTGMAGAALAEGLDSFDLSRQELAWVDGEVYAIGKPGLLGCTSVCRVTETGLVTVWSTGESLRGIYPWGNELLVVTQRGENMNYLFGTPVTQSAFVLDPASGRAHRWQTTTEGELMARNGVLWRIDRDGADAHCPVRAWRLTSAGWEIVADFRSDAPVKSFGGFLYNDFLTLCLPPAGDNAADGLFMDADTGERFTLTGLDFGFNHLLRAVRQDGRLYYLGHHGFHAVDTETGMTCTLLDYPEYAYRAFAMDDTRFILIERDRVDVYDRVTMTLQKSIATDTFPTDCLLTGDVLYIRNQYWDIDSGGERHFLAVIDLTDGTCTHFD